ncbi:MAG: TIM barrel protein [Phycisphaerae bacterium]|mgnify:CR=1 FL=1|nr:TIM barrel protein [Phycisphaerae bacterium]
MELTQRCVLLKVSPFQRPLSMNRRDFIATSAAGALAVPALSANQNTKPEATPAPRVPVATADFPITGRLKHSVCRWCYSSMSLEDLCKFSKAMGIASVELLGEKEWPTVAAAGLTCAVANGPTGIGRGWNRVENHDGFVKETERLLPLMKAAGIPNMIVFSGNRAGMSDAEGLDNCATGLKRVTPLAEELGVTIIMELLNSKIDHHDYMCDRTPWGVELVKRVGSDRFKLLYDIYHMQIMEGDVIRTIRDNYAQIAHFHTGGNPGRNEIDVHQELQYRGIATAIADLGFQGYLAQEFIPKRDPMVSLREAIAICSV